MSDEEADAHRAPGTIVRNSVVFRDRSARCAADSQPFSPRGLLWLFLRKKEQENLRGEVCKTAAQPLHSRPKSATVFLCTFGLTQKYQKVKHGEKLRVPSPSLAERARKTALFAAQKDAPLRLWRLGKVRKRPLPSPAAVVRTPAPGARTAVRSVSSCGALRRLRCASRNDDFSCCHLFLAGRRPACFSDHFRLAVFFGPFFERKVQRNHWRKSRERISTYAWRGDMDKMVPIFDS